MSRRNVKDIFDAIEQYAIAYRRLEQIQRAHTYDIPIGDQKTGVIAEFYARIYAKHRFRNGTFEFGSASEHAWDIKVVLPRQREIKVQVKAVSAHSQTSRVSPIHPGWHELWLMRLDEHLRPQALWVFKASNVPWSKSLLKNRTMPKLRNANSGSAELRGGADETKVLLAALVTANSSSHRACAKSRASR